MVKFSSLVFTVLNEKTTEASASVCLILATALSSCSFDFVQKAINFLSLTYWIRNKGNMAFKCYLRERNL